MDGFKRDNFQRRYPGSAFPVVDAMEPSVCDEVRQQVAMRLGGSPVRTGAALVREIAEDATPIPGVDAENDDFDLFRVLDSLALPYSEHVLLNWERFDRLDRIRLRDLREYFSDIWYPGSDDLDVIDLDAGWILSIRHDGGVLVLRLPHDT
ncbi:hypothetical protein [Gemmatimonas aurantiaca]|uniref:hypothetical protein n=1 Tax=Gemmatimonas aurantiaca TaxID=173480 RepID=UPI00301E2FA7